MCPVKRKSRIEEKWEVSFRVCQAFRIVVCLSPVVLDSYIIILYENHKDVYYRSHTFVVKKASISMFVLVYLIY